MHPNLDWKNDALWKPLPQPFRRNLRDQFIFRAAERHGLTSKFTVGKVTIDRVEKNFYEALRDCPLPDDGRLSYKYQPQDEDYFIHLTLKRLEGLQLPISLDAFAPKS